MIFSLFDKRMFIAVHKAWFRMYITEQLGRVDGCYNAPKNKNTYSKDC